MISEEKKAGACAAVLILTGVDQIAYVIASLQLGGETFWWLRVGVIAGFLFLGLHLLMRGPKFSRAHSDHLLRHPSHPFGGGKVLSR